ncbi:MAG TPA: hypothetical protein VGL56_18335 [Fimbriimonadaceae bacterium]|jgi:hypothetical protein
MSDENKVGFAGKAANAINIGIVLEVIRHRRKEPSFKTNAGYARSESVVWKSWEDEDDRCYQCGEPTDDGEGWDGLCGNCADIQSPSKLN